MPLIQADLPCPGMLFCGHGFSIFQALQIVIKKKVIQEPLENTSDMLDILLARRVD